MTSTNDYCVSCHIHPNADASWKTSVHYDTQSGYRVACVDCHLPPKGDGYLWAKGTTGLRDLWSKWTKDSASFNWEDRGRLEVARTYVYESSCIKCHENLFPAKLTKAGEDAHLYYTQTKKTDELHCINCHLNAGHFIEGYTHGSNSTFGSTSSAAKEVFLEATKVTEFKNYTERIPKSPISFNMVAIPGGTFKMGSPADEPFRKEDEGPFIEVELSPFFMAEIEVSWDEYLAFYVQTAAEGRSTDTEGLRTKMASATDAISGATPPYGQPDQGWGLGQRPAISFSYHAAETYCKWLTSVTGKTYRLPTEAEWEYSAKGGENYKYAGSNYIDEVAWYENNAGEKTHPVGQKKPNGYGLYDMIGNVCEWCSDWYGSKYYNESPLKNPKGPNSGSDRVIRGNSWVMFALFMRDSVRGSGPSDGGGSVGFRVVW